MRVTFLNVGQADSTLVTDDAEAALVLIDGATRQAIRRHLPLLRAAGRLPRIVGTHYDQDHLSGLTAIVEDAGAEVGMALLPPVLDPVRRNALRHARGPGRGARSPWLADVLAELRLLETVRPLVDPGAAARAEGRDDELSGARRRLAERLEMLLANRDALVDLAARPPRDDERFGDDGPWLDDLPPGRVRIVDDNLLDPELIAAVRTELIALAGPGELPVIDLVLSLALSIATLPDPGPRWARLLTATEVDGLFHEVGATAQELIVATTMNKLVEALQREEVPWFTPVAPDEAHSDFELVPGLAAVHLSPTDAMLERVWRRLPTLAEPGVTGRRPTIANEISHVLVLFPVTADRRWWRRQSHPFHGFLATGDTHMTDLPAGAQEWIRRCTLIDVAHHGGSWGRFPDVLAAAHAGETSPLTLYVSIAQDRTRSSTPGKGHLDDLLARLRVDDRPVRLWASNLQPEAAAAWHGETAAPGPPQRRFVRTPYGWFALDDRPPVL